MSETAFRNASILSFKNNHIIDSIMIAKKNTKIDDPKHQKQSRSDSEEEGQLVDITKTHNRRRH